MPYAFSQDEETLLFFAFTPPRIVCIRAAVVETRSLPPRDYGEPRVELSRDGRLAGTLWGLTKSYWRLPGFELLAHADISMVHARLLPAGTHLLHRHSGDSAIVPVPWQRQWLPRRLDAVIDDQLGAAIELDGDGRTLAPLELGWERPTGLWNDLHLAEDGTVLWRVEDQLICAQFDLGGRWPVLWRRALRVPPDSGIRIHGDAERCTLLIEPLHRRSRPERKYQLFSWRQPDAAPRSLSFSSHAEPALAGATLVYQPTPTTLVHCDLDDDDGDPRDYQLPDDAGPGELFAGARGSLLFHAHTGSRLIDLRRGSERSLSPVRDSK
ncbi:MAG: hypothetical protein KC431_08205 [Myxococcales bacterium]|nr:hypothetical protein [Myxococcales bacterium]